MRLLAAGQAARKPDVIEMARTLRAKRRRIADKPVPAIKAEYLIGIREGEVLSANRAVRGIDQVIKSGQEVFQHAAMVALP